MTHPSTFREKVRNSYRKYRAVMLLTRSITPELRYDIDETLRSIDTTPGPALRREWSEMKIAITTAMRDYGVVGTVEQLEALVRSAEERPGQVAMVWKGQIEEVFTKFGRALSAFDHLPQHARIGLDIHGVEGQLSWFLLEAALFEDLAALWNDAWEKRDLRYPAVSKRELKHASALKRAAAKAAFGLLEAYLNGIAVDVLFTRTDITDRDRAKLLERDGDRQFFLSLREKILQYPKIALRSVHPPLAESSSRAMQTVLATEVEVRHALIHPKFDREPSFLELPIERVGELCDAVVELITEIATCLGGDFGDIRLWLTYRGANGSFPEHSFE